MSCYHGRQRSRCKDCGGKGMCPHNRLLADCVDCGGSSVCHHNRHRTMCKECNPRNIYNKYARSAKKRGLVFLLTFDEYTRLSKSPCRYCGSSAETNGIDRVNNNLGYTSENSAACCTLCNFMKRTLTEKQFLSHAEKIAKHQEACKTAIPTATVTPTR